MQQIASILMTNVSNLGQAKFVLRIVSVAKYFRGLLHRTGSYFKIFICD